MPFSTNYTTAGGLDTSGLAVAAGTERRQVVLDIRDAIVGDANSRWEEVTGGSPTPAALQPFASTINAGNASGSAYGFGEHVTLYLADDSGLVLGTPGARLLRIYVGYAGIQFGIIDSVLADPAVADNWVQGIIGAFSDANRSAAYDYSLCNQTGVSYTDESTAATWQVNMRVFYALDDDFLWVGGHYPSFSSNADNQLESQEGAFIHHPEPPTNTMVGREDMPWIFLNRYVHPYSHITPQNLVYVPQGGAFTAHDYVKMAWPGDPTVTDAQTRHPFFPTMLAYYNNGPNFIQDSFSGRLRVCDGSLFTGNARYEEVDIGGVPYLNIGPRNFSGTDVAIKMAA